MSTDATDAKDPSHAGGLRVHVNYGRESIFISSLARLSIALAESLRNTTPLSDIKLLRARRNAAVDHASPRSRLSKQDSHLLGLLTGNVSSFSNFKNIAIYRR